MAESHSIIFGDTVDLNASLNGGAVDQDIIYEVPHIYADVITIGAGGIVTPLKEGGAIIVIKDATTLEEINKVVLRIQPADGDTLVIGIVNVGP